MERKACSKLGIAKFLLLLVLTAIVFIPSQMWGHVPEGNGEALQLHSAWCDSPPTIDGDITGNPAEWDDAFCREIYLDNGSPAYLYIMNDASNLYISVVYGLAGNNSANNRVIMYFDEGVGGGTHDDILTAGEENAVSSNRAAAAPWDLYWTGTGWKDGAGYASGDDDDAVAGDTDFDVLETYATNIYTWEFRIPITLGGFDLLVDGGDSIFTGDELGFFLAVFNNGDQWRYWDELNGLNDPGAGASDEPKPIDPGTGVGWADIILGKPKEFMTFSATTNANGNPTIDGDISEDAWRGSYERDIIFTDFQGNTIDATIYSINDSAADDFYFGIRVHDLVQDAADYCQIYQEQQNPGPTSIRDYVLDDNQENAIRITSGVATDWYFDNPGGGGIWADDTSAADANDAIGDSTYIGTYWDYEFQVSYNSGGPDPYDLDQLGPDSLIGFLIKYYDDATGRDFYWEYGTNTDVEYVDATGNINLSIGWPLLRLGAPYVQVIHPENGTTVQGTVPIDAWVVPAGGANIDSVEYQIEGEAGWTAMTQVADTEWWFGNWNSTLKADGVYEIRIRATDDNIPARDTTQIITVTVVNVGGSANDPVVAMVSPTIAQIISGTVLFQFTATPQGGADLNTDSCEISVDGSVWLPVDTQPPITGGAGDYSLDTTLLSDGSHIVQVKAVDENGNVGVSDLRLFYIDNSTTVTIITPLPITTISGTESIEAVAPDNTAEVTFEISPDGGANWYDLATPAVLGLVTTDNTPSDGWKYDWDSVNDGLADGAAYQVRARAYDAYGALIAEDVNDKITTDNTAPQVTSINSPTGVAPITVKAGSTVSVNYTYTELNPGVILIEIYDGATEIGKKTISSGLTGGAAVSRTDIISIAGSAAELQYEIRVTVTDESDNTPIPSIENNAIIVDNTAPVFTSVDADQSVYADGDLITIIVDLDEAGLAVTADFSTIDSEYNTSDEAVLDNADTTYTITYTINAANTIPDGSYSILIGAEDTAGNSSNLATSIGLDNTNALGELIASPSKLKDSDTVQFKYYGYENGLSVVMPLAQLLLLDDTAAGDLSLLDNGVAPDITANDSIYTANYIISPANTIADGLKTLTAVVTDGVGNIFNPEAGIELDNAAPAHTSTLQADSDTIYRNEETITLVTDWDGIGYLITANFINVDSNYVSGSETVTDNGDTTYTIEYTISKGNANVDGAKIIVISALDEIGNGPVNSNFGITLDNTAPIFTSVGADQSAYADGDIITITADLDAAGLAVTADFSTIDSEYNAGDEVVLDNTDTTYTITYTINAANTIPDGSYSLEVAAEDSAGNISSANTSVELDNTPEPTTIIQPLSDYSMNDIIKIEAIAPDDTSRVDFSISPDGITWYDLVGVIGVTSDINGADGWEQDWDTTADGLADSTGFMIRVQAYDEMGVFISEDTVTGLLIDNTSPGIAVVVSPAPIAGPLDGEVYVNEVIISGTVSDLPNPNGVENIIIEVRNENGDHVNNSPIGILNDDNSFSHIVSLIEGNNDITVTAIDVLDNTISETFTLTYIVPQGCAVVNADGGTVSSPDGSGAVIPEDALIDKQNLCIVSVSKEDLYKPLNADYILMGAAHEFSPDHLTFHEQITITLAYTDAELDPDQDQVDEWDETQLIAFHWTGFEWVRVGGEQRDLINNKISFNVNHFGLFCLGLDSDSSGSDLTAYLTSNPFTPESGTSFVFDLPEKGTVNLSIYDVTGDLVRNVIKDVSFEEGKNSARWDGTNDFGGYVGSGIYIYILELTNSAGDVEIIKEPIGVVK